MELRIVGIDGTARASGVTRQLLRHVGESIQNCRATFEIFSQVANPLPTFDGESATAKSPVVQALFSMARDADAFVLSSPEYHGGMSGALKNALDWLTFDDGGVQVEGKVFGLVGGGGSLANSGATLQMMMTVRSLHGWLMPDVIVSVTNIWDEFNETGLISSDPSLETRIAQFADKMTRYADQFRMMRERLAA